MGNSLDPLKQLGPRIVAIAPHRDQQQGFVRNDIMFRTGLETADGNDSRVLRIDFTTYQSLERANDAARENDGILGRVRIGTMTANALHQYIDTIDIGECEAG